MMKTFDEIADKSLEAVDRTLKENPGIVEEIIESMKAEGMVFEGPTVGQYFEHHQFSFREMVEFISWMTGKDSSVITEAYNEYLVRE